MIILTCPECSVQYRLDQERLGREGHEVQCTACNHVWFERRTELAAANTALIGTQENDQLAAPVADAPAIEEGTKAAAIREIRALRARLRRQHANGTKAPTPDAE